MTEILGNYKCIDLWRLRKTSGQILAVWTLAAKLPNSDLNFAVDFVCGGGFPPVISPRAYCRKGYDNVVWILPSSGKNDVNSEEGGISTNPFFLIAWPKSPPHRAHHPHFLANFPASASEKCFAGDEPCPSRIASKRSIAEQVL